MIKIEYDGDVIEIPSKMEEVSLSQFQRVSKLKLKNDKKYFIRLLECFNIPRVVINSINVENYIIIKNALTILFADIDRPLQTIINFNGDKYKFTDKHEDIRMDQFTDLMECSDSNEEIIDNLHIISSLLYRKVIDEKNDNGNIIYITEEYDSSVVLDRAEKFKKMDLGIFLGVLGFFFHLKMTFIKGTLRSSPSQEKKQN